MRMQAVHVCTDTVCVSDIYVNRWQHLEMTQTNKPTTTTTITKNKKKTNKKKKKKKKQKQQKLIESVRFHRQPFWSWFPAGHGHEQIGGKNASFNLEESRDQQQQELSIIKRSLWLLREGREGGGWGNFPLFLYIRAAFFFNCCNCYQIRVAVIDLLWKE